MLMSTLVNRSSLRVSAFIAALGTGVFGPLGCYHGFEEEDGENFSLIRKSTPKDPHQSWITAENVYVRYRPQGAGFDYFMYADNVQVHAESYSGTYLCVTGTTRYGLKHSGWVSKGTVKEVGGRDGKSGVCTDYSKGGTEVSYPCCRVIDDTAFRYGPISNAARIVDDVTPEGTIQPGDPSVGWATTSTGNSPRVPEGDYVWVTRRCENADGAPDVAPARAGWVRVAAIDCSGNAPSSPPEPPEPDEQEPDEQEPDGQEPDEQEPDEQEPDEPDEQEPDEQEPDEQEPDEQEPAEQEPEPVPNQCYARCCDESLQGPVDTPDTASCHTASQTMCESFEHVKRSEWNGQEVWKRPNACWAKCWNRTAYHQVDVAEDCTAHATNYCNEGDRGGLEDAMWSQCEP